MSIGARKPRAQFAAIPAVRYASVVTSEGPFRLVSVNIGQPTAVKATDAKGVEHTVVTGIYKNPVEGRVLIRRHGPEGDGQADTRVFRGQQVHGGEDKAVYVYAAEHYAYWEAELQRTLTFGQFGENLTATGMLETEIRIGDILRIGEALLEVTEPRGPCYKLDIKMRIPEFHKRFKASGRTGFYTRVLEPGTVAAGDTVEIVNSDPERPTVVAVVLREVD
jgi:MOSC domain-containing protein YiiM